MRHLALLALALFAAPLAAQPVAERTVGTATLQNVPDIPADIEAAVQRYQNYRSATFEDWLADGSMLITTRFGATDQIHRLTAPLGARGQLTFFAEPVQAAQTIPGHDAFVLMRDTGGDEWFQLEAMGLSGEPVRLTEPVTRNGSMVFSDDGAMMVWSRAGQNSASYQILAADPADPQSRRTIYTHEGTISPADISPGGSKVLLERYISNRESELYILDMASGEAARFAASDEPVLDESAHFARGGRSIVAISNRGSDHRRLVEFDIASGAMTVLSPGLDWDVEGFELSDDGRIPEVFLDQLAALNQAIG